MTNGAQIVVRAPADLTARFAVLARARGRSFAAEARDALEEHLSRALHDDAEAVQAPARPHHRPDAEASSGGKD